MRDIKSPRSGNAAPRNGIKKYKIRVFNINANFQKKPLGDQVAKWRKRAARAARIGAIFALIFLFLAQGGLWQAIDRFLRIFPAYAQTTMYAQNSYKWYANADAVQPTDAWPSGSSNLSENDPIVQNAVRNLEHKLPGGWLKGTAEFFSAIAYDSANKTVYVGGDNARFGKYDTRFDTFTDLSSQAISVLGSYYTYGIKSLIFDSTNSVVYIGGAYGEFAKYEPAANTATRLTPKISSFWTSSNYVYELAFDSVNSVVYLGGGGGKFAKYTPSTDTATDLTSKISSFWSTQPVYGLTFDSINSVIYLGGGTSSPKFAKYTPASDTATDLTSKVSAFWPTNKVSKMVFDSTNTAIYFIGGIDGGASNKFGKYVPATDTATDLTSRISSWWTSYVYSIAFDSANSVIYLGGGFSSSASDKKFAKYNPATDAATDLTSYVWNAGLWGTSANSIIRAMTAENGNIWFAGQQHVLARYNASATAVGEDLSSKISSFWGGSGVSAIAYDSTQKHIYLGGGNGKFAKYNPNCYVAAADSNKFFALNSIKKKLFDFFIPTALAEYAEYYVNIPCVEILDLTSVLGLPSSGASDITSMVFNSTNGKIYLSTWGGGLYSYDPAANSAASLYSSGGTIIRAITTDGTYVNIFGEDGLFVRYTISNGATTSYTPTVTNDNPPPTSYPWNSGVDNYWAGDDIFAAVSNGLFGGFTHAVGGGGSANKFVAASAGTAADRKDADSFGSGPTTITSLSYNSSDGKVYQGGMSGEFANVDLNSCSGSPISCPASNLNSQVSFIGGATINAQVVGNNLIYLGGSGGQFGYYDSAAGTGTNLTSAISSFWGANQIYPDGLEIDADEGVVYLGGASGKFARYPSAGSRTVVNHSKKLPGYWITNSAYVVQAIAKDTVNNRIYLSGPSGKFAVYDPSADAFVDLTSRISGLSGWSSADITSLVFDSINGVIYIGGVTGGTAAKFAKYNPATDSASDLSSKITGWLANGVKAMAFDSTNSIVYLVGAGGGTSRFVKYNPATDTATNLNDRISSFCTSNGYQSIIFNSINSVIYMGGVYCGFAKYTPATDTAEDLTPIIGTTASLSNIRALAFDFVNNVVYLSNTGSYFYFGKYTPATNSFVDLSSKITQFWTPSDIYSMAFDSANKNIYIGSGAINGSSGKIIKYNTNNETAYDLTSQLTFNGGTSAGIQSLFFDSQNKVLYFGGGAYGYYGGLRFGKIYTAQILPQNNDVLRLRMNVRIGDTALGIGAQSFKLQYGALSTTCSAISSWTDVGGVGSGAIWRGYNNGTPSDGATLTSNLLYQSDVSGTYEEENNSAANPNGVSVLNDIEYDWVLQNNGAPNNTSYCFRMTKSDGTAFTAYREYPQLTTYIPPDFSQNYYRWYANADAIQPTDPLPAGSANFGQKDPLAANSAVDLVSRISYIWPSGGYIYGSVFDSTNKVIYIAGSSGVFIKYNTATDAAADLTAKTKLAWAGTPTANAFPLAFDSTNNIVYLATDGGKFAKYNPATDTMTDLSSKLSGISWTVAVYSLTFDSTNNVIYLGGANGKFAKYNPATDTATDLTSQISSFWSTNPVYGLTFDSANSVVYIGGSGGKFAKYTPSSDTATDLTSKISSFWSTSAVNALTFDSANSVVYIGGASGKFAKYVPATDAAADLTSKISSFWSTNPVYVLSFDSANGAVYLTGSAGVTTAKFAKYIPSGRILPQNNDILRLRMSAQNENTPVNSSAQAFKLQYGVLATTCSTVGTWTDIGAVGSGVIWRGYDNTAPSDGAAISANLLATSDIAGTYEEQNNSTLNPNSAIVGQDIEYDFVLQNNGAANNTTYCFRIVKSDGTALLSYADYPQLTTFIPYTLNQNNFRWYQNRDNVQPNDPAPSGSVDLGELDSILQGDAAADLTVKISSAWSTNQIYAAAFDSTNNILYLAGVSGKFGKYNLTINAFTDLTSKISSFWSTNNIIALAFDSANSVVYIGGNGGKFAKYTPSSDTATDLVSKISSFWSANAVNALTFDSANSVVYIGGASGGGRSGFAKYTPATDTAADLSAKIFSFWSTSIVYSLTFDSANSAIYIGGASGKFAKYTPSSDTASDLTTKLTATTWSTNAVNTIVFDSNNSVLYLGGASGKFAKCEIAACAGGGSNATILNTIASFSFWSTQPVLSLSFDSTNNIVYLGGGTSGSALRFGKYDIAANTATDLATRLSSSSVWNASTYAVSALFFKSSIGFGYAGASSGKFAVYRVAQYPAADAQVLRLRSGVQLGVTNLTSSSLQLKLQYGVLATTCSAIGTWTDVGAAGSGVIWRGYNNGTPADGATISASLLSTSEAGQTYEEENPSAVNPNAVLADRDIEYDFAVQANGAAAGTTYCFRFVKFDGTALDAYDTYPAAYMTTGQAPNVPTLDLPINNATLVSQTPALKTTATDPESNDIVYKIELALNNLFTSGLQIFNQELSQTGWSGQNSGGSTRYTSGTQSTYTVSSALSGCTDYYWRSFAKDLLNSNTWSATQSSPNMFTTIGTCNPPNTPTLDSPANGATGVSQTPALQTTADDPNSDDVQYKIEIALNSGFTSGLQTFNQTSSQTGWSGQNSGGGTRYTSGSQGTYTVQTALSACATYYWRSYAFDPTGSAGWSGTQGTPRSFTTTGCNAAPNTPTLSSPANGATGISQTPALSVSTTDPDSDDVQYKIEIALNSGFSSGLQTFDQSVSQTGWSGQNSGGGTRYTSATTGTYTISSALSACTIHYWRAYAKDPLGVNTWSSASSANSFTTTGCNNAPSASVPSSISQSTDGLGRITFSVSISDGESDNTKLKIEYSEDNGTTWYKAQIASVSPNSGSVDVTNSNTYQIGESDVIDTSGGIIDLTIVWDTKSVSNGNGVLSGDQTDVKVRVTPNDGTVDGTIRTSAAFEVDNLAPSGLGSLTFSDVAETQIKANWSQATEANFQNYRLYYDTNSSTVENKTSGYNEFTDIATAQNLLTGLTSATTYFFKLFALDDFGNETATSGASQATLTPAVVLPPVTPEIPPPPRLGSPVIVSPQNDETIFSGDVIIEGFVGEPYLGVIMTLDNISISQTTSNSSGRFYFYLFNLLNGPHSARFQAKNSVGELSGAAYLSFNVEAPVPSEEEPEIYPQEEEGLASPRITSMTQGAVLTENTFILSGWAPANSEVIMLIDGLTLVQTAANGDNAFSFAFFNLANGGHNLRLQARDAGENVSEPYYFAFSVQAPEELVREEEETEVYPMAPAEEAPAEGLPSEIVEAPSGGAGEIAPLAERQTLGEQVSEIAEQTFEDATQTARAVVSVLAETVPQTFQKISLAVSENIPKPHQNWGEQTPVEKTANVAAHTFAVGAAATGAAMTTGIVTAGVGQLGFAFGDVYLLLARFSSTLLSLAGVRRKKPKPWGTVYDSQTKQPLDPAYVQLLDEKGNELETQITDLEGRFGFFIKQSGAYSLLANKTNYKFPSERLQSRTSDELYDNLYFGIPLTLQEGQLLDINIPMDAEKFDWNEFAKKEQGYVKINPRTEILKKKARNFVFWAGLISAPVSYLFSPSSFNLAILGFYFAFVFLRLAGLREKSFGRVYDSKTNSPLSFALISAYYPDIPVKVKSTAADKYGRYYLLIPNGKYYLTAERKNPDGTYELIAKTSAFEVKKGVADMEIRL